MRDVMVELFDGPHATPPPADEGPVFLGIKNIDDSGRLDLGDVRHIAEEDFPNWTRRVTPEAGDVLFTYEATLHRYALVPDGFRGCLGRRVALIRPNRDIVRPRFLHFALLGPAWRTTVTERIISGSTVDRIPLVGFENFPIAIPDRDTQDAIVDVLASLDDLIENNRRRVEVLEEMTRAIYREWFTHLRFPGHEDATVVDSDLGPIPEGWSWVPLFEAADVGFGYSFKSRQFTDTGEFPVIRIRNVPVGQTDTFTDEVADARYRVRDDDVLIGMDGEFYVAQWSGGDAWLNQRVARLRPKLGLGARYLLHAVEGPIRDWNSKIVGTTVAHLGKKHMVQIAILRPNDDLLRRTNSALEPTATLIRDLKKQSRASAALRDMLLPKLVTGQIDVKRLDLDAMVERAAV